MYWTVWLDDDTGFATPLSSNKVPARARARIRLWYPSRELAQLDCDERNRANDCIPVEARFKGYDPVTGKRIN